MPKTISTVLFNDSLEHFNKEDGLSILEMAEEIAVKRIIVFTPRGFFPQKGYDYFKLQGEEFQEHRSGWEANEFLDLGYHVIVFKGLHNSDNLSFLESFGKYHPSLDGILAWKDLDQ
jgi:hypothetical protein